MRPTVDVDRLKQLSDELSQERSRIRREQKKLETVYKIIIEANEGLSYDTLLQNALKSVLISLEFDRGIISYLFPDFDETIIHTVNVPDFEAFQSCEQYPYLARDKVLKEGQVHEILDFESVYPCISKKYGIQKIVTAPIHSPLGVIGYIQLYSDNPDPLDDDMKQILLMIAHHLGNSLVRVYYEKKLEKERTNFKNLFEEVRDGILILNEECCILHANKAFCSLVNKDLGTLLRSPLSAYLSVSDDCLSSVLKKVDPENCLNENIPILGTTHRVDITMNNVSWNSKPALALLMRVVT